MADATYNVIVPEKGAPIKAWTKGVQLEDRSTELEGVTVKQLIHEGHRL
jgi:hypothetical protein